MVSGIVPVKEVSMLQKLVLVRHGDAEFFGPEGTDESRRLTKRGAEVLAAEYPSTFEPLKDVDDITFWVSPAVRAIQTAEIAADVLDVDPDEFDMHVSLYEQDDDEFLAELGAEGDGTVVAVGHIPFMHRILWKLTGEDVPFSKGSVASVVFENGDIDKAMLEWFVDGPED